MEHWLDDCLPEGVSTNWTSRRGNRRYHEIQFPDGSQVRSVWVPYARGGLGLSFTMEGDGLLEWASRPGLASGTGGPKGDPPRMTVLPSDEATLSRERSAVCRRS